MACRAEYPTEFNPVATILPSLKKPKKTKPNPKQNTKQTKRQTKTFEKPQNQQPKNSNHSRESLMNTADAIHILIIFIYLSEPGEGLSKNVEA